MTRIAVIADSHFDETSRFEETIRIHDWIAGNLERRGVDLIVHAGDVFERRSTPRERLAVAAWLQRVAELAPVVIVRGNHDAVGDLVLLQHLETTHPVIVEEAAGVYVVAGVAVGCLAWPRRSEILAAGATTRADAEGDVGAALRAVLLGLGAEMRQHHGPRVLLAHAMVRGSVTSTGQPLVGVDMEVGLEDLALVGADAVVLGHVHMGQEWYAGATPIVYPGSPRRATFGELEPKGYLLVDFGRPAPFDIDVQRIETPATPMIHVSASIADSECMETGASIRGMELDDDEYPGVSGAEVRLRYQVAADERELGRQQADAWRTTFLREGAASVRVEEVVIATTRARAPEVAAAPTVAEKLAAYWAARDQVPPPERANELVRKLAQIEGGA